MSWIPFPTIASCILTTESRRCWDHWLRSVAFLAFCCLLVLLSGSIALATILGSLTYYLHSNNINYGRNTDRLQPVRLIDRSSYLFDVLTISRQTLATLNELVTASNLWESTVHEVHALIENEENSCVAPRSSLRSFH